MIAQLRHKQCTEPGTPPLTDGDAQKEVAERMAAIGMRGTKYASPDAVMDICSTSEDTATHWITTHTICATHIWGQ